MEPYREFIGKAFDLTKCGQGDPLNEYEWTKKFIEDSPDEVALILKYAFELMAATRGVDVRTGKVYKKQADGR